MIYVLYFLHVLVSIFLIGVVLLQSGKGADLSVFGGGGTQAAFGARGGANILHKLTVAGFVLFTLTTLSIGLFQSRTPSVMSGVEAAPSEALPSDIPAASTTGAAAPAGVSTTDDATSGNQPAEAEVAPAEAPATESGDDTPPN